MAQYAVLLTSREILGKEPELAHLHALLAKYQRKEVLFLLAKLNCLLGTWQNALDFNVDIKLTRILLSSYYSQIDKLRRASGGRVLFSRITILYLAKQACIACGDTGAMMDDARSYEAIGLACLMANDLMLPFMPSPQDGTLERLAKGKARKHRAKLANAIAQTLQTRKRSEWTCAPLPRHIRR